MRPLKVLLESLEFSERLSKKLCQGEISDNKNSKSENTNINADEALIPGEE